MREAAFRAFLAARLSPGSLQSYVSIGRRLEREFGTSLDAFDFTEEGLANLRRCLASFRAGSGVERGVGNSLTVARAYGEFSSGSPVLLPMTLPVPNSPAKAAPQLAMDRPEMIRSAGVRELLKLHVAVGEELRDRGVLRTGNGPVGDYGEHLFAKAFGWTLEPNSASGHDATDPAGLRFQIKSRRLTKRNSSRQLGAIRRLPDHRFDYLAAVLFDDRFDVVSAALIPHDAVTLRAKYRQHTNSWLLMLDDPVWKLAGVKDVTAALEEAALA